VPLLTIPTVIFMFPGRYGSAYLVAGLGCYVLAKVTEAFDHEILR
jgi:hypothetical protein